MDFIKKHTGILFALGTSLLIMWGMLLPGYILTLDSSLTPGWPVNISQDGFRNFLPVGFLLHWLSILLPTWLVQKLFLITLFTSIVYFAYRFLPLPNDTKTRIFASLIHLLNPFVYSRVVSGQFSHLFAYAFLPLLVHFIFKWRSESTIKNTVGIFVSLFLISIFSVHFFLMCVIITAVLVVYKTTTKQRISQILIGGALLLVATSYWTIPALNRPAPLEQRFGTEHWEAFAPASYENVGVLPNLLTLNGFWGQNKPWGDRFLWPQDFFLYWYALAALGLIIAVGIWFGVKNKNTRTISLSLLVIGFFVFIFASGASDTVFKSLNIWMFQHVPFWSGFRDSHKFVGLLALLYAFAGGYGYYVISSQLKTRWPKWNELAIPAFLILPVLFGYIFLGGFQGQLTPVFYPSSWYEVKRVTDIAQPNEKVLALPWHGYMSFRFTNNRILSNPAQKFFGNNIIQSRSVELNDVYDQESDPVYANLDNALTASSTNNQLVLEQLKNNNIKYIIFFRDLEGYDTLSYPYLESSAFEKIYESEDIRLYKINE